MLQYPGGGPSYDPDLCRLASRSGGRGAVGQTTVADNRKTYKANHKQRWVMGATPLKPCIPLRVTANRVCRNTHDPLGGVSACLSTTCRSASYRIDLPRLSIICTVRHNVYRADLRKTCSLPPKETIHMEGSPKGPNVSAVHTSSAATP